LLNGVGEDLRTSLDSHLEERVCSVGLDTMGGLQREWEVTCSEEAVRALIIRWDTAVFLVKPVSTLEQPVSKKLQEYGFRKTIDKLVLRIASAITDKIVVTEDGEFWDPADNKKEGDRNAKVARLCRDHLQIEVLLLPQFFPKLPQDSLDFT
jgi:hypothetical protein